jgi:hypothetical protein
VNLDQAEELLVAEIPGASSYRLVARMTSGEQIVLRTFPDQVEAEIELHRLAQEVDARGDDSRPSG